MCEVYRYFSKDWSHICTYTEDDMRELFYSETHGLPIVNSLNGFAIGKKVLNVTVSMWKEDIRNGTLFKCELYDDPNLPTWWLDKVLKNL